jgi:hypothetical protein
MFERATWFQEAKWGVFCHYLAEEPSANVAPHMTADEWNARVDSFNVQGLVQQLVDVGAPYFFITIGQGSGFYCSPNQTYDSIVGMKPSKCSRRDLVQELADALIPRGIKLLTYLPANAPRLDHAATEKLGGHNANNEVKQRMERFQHNWEAIMREWSLRWGDKVSGWWIDGCLFADVMYNHREPPNFQSFADALRAGNPNSLVALSGGAKLPVRPLTSVNDYTAGELYAYLQVNAPIYFDKYGLKLNGTVDGALLHILTYLGGFWGVGEPRFPVELPIGYTKHINACGGVVTWDVPIMHNGLIPEAFIAQLSEISKAVGTSPA